MMKEFFKSRSYDMVKMFLNQFGTGIFGVALSIAVTMAKHDVLRNVTSVFAILFYLFLLYTMTWDIGFKDKISVEHGRKPYKPWTGFWISLCANIPNLVLAVFISLASFFNVGFLSAIGGVCGAIALVLEGMFTGVLANSVGGAPLNSYWWVWFLITVPSMVICAISYYFGLKDVKFTKLFNYQYPESDREPKKKNRK